MSDNFIRHLISLCALLVVGLAYFSGYMSAGLGWWWTAIGLIAVYAIVYKLVEA